MGTSQYGFAPKDIANRSRYSAFIATWNQPSKPAGGLTIPLGTYGAVLAGGGQERQFWAVARSPFPVPLIAFAVRRLIAAVPPEVRLQVYAHKDMETYISGSGHAREASRNNGLGKSGQPFPAYSTFSAILEDLDLGRWTFHPLEKTSWRGPVKAAKALAQGPAREVLLKHSDVTSGPVPIPSERVKVLVEGR